MTNQSLNISMRSVRTLSAVVMVCCLCGALFFYGRPQSERQARIKSPETITLQPLLECHNGDLVFRRGESFTSRVVLACDPEAVFSHVGMVYKTRNQVMVIHAVPGEQPPGKKQPLKCEPLESFLKGDLAIDYRICRIRHEHRNAARAAAEIAHSFFINGYWFDDKFDLATPKALYCTELVWKAYQKAGLELLSEQDFSQAPFSNSRIIYPSAFFQSGYFASAR